MFLHLREKTKQHEHFAVLDLCDSITLNILSPEQLHSNHHSSPNVSGTRPVRTAALLIARLKSLCLIDPVIHEGINSVSKTSCDKTKHLGVIRAIHKLS